MVIPTLQRRENPLSVRLPGGWVRNLFPPYGDRAIAETRTPCFFRGYRLGKSKNPKKPLFSTYGKSESSA